MTGEISKRKLKGITKALSRDYLAEKERRKQLRRDKANRPKTGRHKSRQQEIEELVEHELELEGGGDDVEQ